MEAHTILLGHYDILIAEMRELRTVYARHTQHLIDAGHQLYEMTRKRDALAEVVRQGMTADGIDLERCREVLRWATEPAATSAAS